MSFKNLHKKILVALPASLIMCVMSGCLFFSSTEELYSLPSLPNEYIELDARMNEIISSGCEYAAPTSGENIQSLQLIDLDNDGVEEAVACFRNSSESKPLKIYVFRVSGDTYVQTAVIEGSGTAIDRVDYVDINGDGTMEIIVGWKMSTEKAMTVYDMRGGQMTAVMESAYTRYVTTDFNGDGLNEIVVIRSDNDGGCVADLCGWNGDSEEVIYTTRLSVPLSGLSDVTVGKLSDGSTAMFVSGMFDETNNVTDILRYGDNSLVNITMSNLTGVSSVVYVNRTLEPSDIDGDGIIEVPIPSRLYSDNPDVTYWEIHWTQYDSKGNGKIVCTTYHNISDGWYIVMPERWIDNITVSKVETSTDERIATFAYLDRDNRLVDFLEISTLTGDTRESIATRSDRFILRTRTSAIYTARFLDGNSDWKDAVDEEGLKAAFNIIQKVWRTGE